MNDLMGIKEQTHKIMKDNNATTKRKQHDNNNMVKLQKPNDTYRQFLSVRRT